MTYCFENPCISSLEIYQKKNVKIIGSEDLEGGCKQKDNPTTPLHIRQSCYNYRISR
jgi:hypothetical protein